jgi:CRP/FNR family cyclic AMP-dependent transcriptional regulator
MSVSGRALDEHYCLAEVELFRDLSRREMAELGARAPMRTVAGGQVIYSPVRPVEVLVIVKRGRVRLFRSTAEGRSVTTAVLGPGSVFGEMAPLGLRMRTTWAEALGPSELCLMSRTDVARVLFTDDRIALRIAEQLSARVAELEQRLTDLTCKRLDQRLAATLCSLAHVDTGGGTPEVVRLTHQQLANLVGATRERTSTALGALAADGLLALRRGKIIIRDPAGLLIHADTPEAGDPVQALADPS